MQLHPVGGFDGGSVARALLLLLHLGVELLLVDGHLVLAQDELGQVEREAIGVVEGECLATRNLCLASLAGVGNHLLDELHAGLERAQERVLLLLAHMLDQVGLCGQLGIGGAHTLDECVDQAVHERLAHAQERVAIAHGTAQDAADDVASLGIAGQLAVGDAEGDGTHMVGHHAHGHVHIMVVAIALATDVANLADERLEHVGVVV